MLSAPVEEAGGDSRDGSTASKAVQQMEMLRHKLLDKAISVHHDRDARPVTVFPNVAEDKCAGRWLLTSGGRDLGLSSAVFKEALSSHLCLPSPAIQGGGWVGKAVGTRGAIIDKFGDAVMSCGEICGDTWRRRHDGVKQAVVQESLLSGVQVDCEVYGLFADLLPAVLVREGGELQHARARQGLVPDFKLLLNTPEGPDNCLAELKMIGAGKTWYPRGRDGRGTERRATELRTAYERALWKYDSRFYGTAPRGRAEPHPPPGPLVHRLRSFGRLQTLVAGPWGDLSDDFHELLKLMAETRVANQARARGWEASEGELGLAMGAVRRAISVAVVRAQSLCLLERLAFLGPGVRAAVQRRQLADRLLERRRRDEDAYRQALASRGLRRVGRTYVE